VAVARHCHWSHSRVAIRHLVGGPTFTRCDPGLPPVSGCPPSPLWPPAPTRSPGASAELSSEERRSSSLFASALDAEFSVELQALTSRTGTAILPAITLGRVLNQVRERKHWSDRSAFSAHCASDPDQRALDRGTAAGSGPSEASVGHPKRMPRR
jgi:hypothetical protein